jgi:hypothetical protein
MCSIYYQRFAGSAIGISGRRPVHSSYYQDGAHSEAARPSYVLLNHLLFWRSTSAILAPVVISIYSISDISMLANRAAYLCEYHNRK